jgi:hypothetical protein
MQIFSDLMHSIILTRSFSMKRKQMNRIIVLSSLLLLAVSAMGAPVPDTGQTTCYDVAGNVITCPYPGQYLYGQDANTITQPMSYTKLDEKGNVLPKYAESWAMVRDNVTGLIWELKTNKDGIPNYADPHDADNTYTWYDSNPKNNGGNAGTPGDGNNTESFINALNEAAFGGYSDWRMPDEKELASIVDFSIPSPGPAIDTVYFPDTASSWHWTRTTLADYTENAWLVHFDTSNVHAYYKSNRLYVRAVRGGKSGSVPSTDNGDYTDHNDGTVTDNSTGLMWQQADTSDKTWADALAYCTSLNLGGYTDWRLPNIKELRSLVAANRSNPAIDTAFFPETSATWFWSSTTNASTPYDAWIVNFYFGDVDGHGKINEYHVRAVRGGRPYIPPEPVIQANGQRSSISVTSNDMVTIQAGLSTGDERGKNAGWWIACNSPSGWYSLTTSGWTAGLFPLFEHPLFHVTSTEIFKGKLPVGDFTFYFVLDMNPGYMPFSSIYYDDQVDVHVTD